MASMIGMPAFMNTASWREKWPTSLRGTIFFVISKLRTLFFSTDLERLEASLEQREVRGAGGLGVLDAGDLLPVGVDRLVGELVESLGRAHSVYMLLTTSSTDVMSCATRLMASSRSVRIPCFFARLRSSSWVAHPTMSRLISGVMCRSS